MKLDKKTMLKIFLLAAGCIFLYWILCEMDKVAVLFSGVARIFAPFATGAIIAFILNVPMRAYERLLSRMKRPVLRRIIAICLTLISVLIVLTAVFLLLLPQLLVTIIQLFTSLKDLPDGIVNVGKSFLNRYPQIYDWVSNNVDLESVDFSSLIKDLFPKLGDIATGLFSHLFSMIGSVASGVIDAFLAIVFSIYCLFNKDTLARQGRKLLYAFFPEKFSDRVIRVLRLSNATFSNFLSGQCVEACILGSLFAVVMALFNMPYIPLICVLISVTAFIPIVGALIGCFVGAFLIAVNDPVLAVYFVIISIVLQQIENNLIYPRVVGTSIGLPGMWVLLAVSVGGAIMGVGGMFLMIPLSSVLYSIVRLYTNKRLQERNVDEEKLKCQPLLIERPRLERKAKKTKENSEE